MNDHIPRRHNGQCRYCGAFRPDGKPVTVHFHRCKEGPDGEEVGILRTGRYHLTASHAPTRGADTFEPWRQEQRQRDREARQRRKVNR